MQGEFAELIAALHDFEECASSAALWQSIKEHASRLNVSVVMVTTGPEIDPFTREDVTYTDLAEPVIVRLETALGKITRSTKRSRLAMRSTDPFLVSKSTRGSRSSRTVAWYATLRRVLGADALFVVPVHRFESVAGIATFAGQAVNFDSHTRSFLSVLASAGFARAAEIAGLPTPQTRQARLSARELACLGHYSKDRSVPEIGRRLGITARTVRFHLDNARTKLSVVTRAQAVRKATRQGLIVKA